MPPIRGVHHVALTVTDLGRSAAWYERVLGATRLVETELFEGHPVVLFQAGPLWLGLHRDRRVEAGDRFTEFRVGLDHLSFAAANRAEVEAWAARLQEQGVAHSGVKDAPYGHVLVFRDPDNIQLEVMAPPGAGGPAPGDAPAVRGVSHVALTVRDLEASARWYREVLAPCSTVVSMREEGYGIEYLATEDGTVIGLHGFAAVPEGDRFSEFRVGLDHLSFTCPSREALDAWDRHLGEVGAVRSPVTEAGYGQVLVFRDPDHVQLELFCQPG